MATAFSALAAAADALVDAAVAGDAHAWRHEGGGLLYALTRCAQNGYGRDVEATLSLLCRSTHGDVEAWAAIKDAPHGPTGRTRLMHAARTGKLAAMRALLEPHPLRWLAAVLALGGV